MLTKKRTLPGKEEPEVKVIRPNAKELEERKIFLQCKLEDEINRLNVSQISEITTEISNIENWFESRKKFGSSHVKTQVFSMPVKNRNRFRNTD